MGIILTNFLYNLFFLIHILVMNSSSEDLFYDFYKIFIWTFFIIYYIIYLNYKDYKTIHFHKTKKKYYSIKLPVNK